jgi:hypothetical protein
MLTPACLLWGRYARETMDSPPALGPSPSSLDIARARDARVCWLLDTHPVTAAMLVEIGWFPSRNKALKRLRRLAAKRLVLPPVGTVSRKQGRPEHVYCRWRPKSNQLQHEVELTELCLRLDAGSVLRGSSIANRAIRPDAEVWIGGQLYFLELDRATMRYAQMARRFRRYEGCQQLSLWVCATEERMEGLRQRAATLRSTALFTTFAMALDDPHAPIWRDFQGAVAALPRQGAKTGE